VTQKAAYLTLCSSMKPQKERDLPRESGPVKVRKSPGCGWIGTDMHIHSRGGGGGCGVGGVGEDIAQLNQDPGMG